MKTRLWILASLVLACDAAPAPNAPPIVEEESVFEDVWDHANPSSRGPAVLNPDDPAHVEEKEPRRVSLDQLRRSIPSLFDGITWTVRIARNDVVAFDALSRTLGEPDYIAVTSENREPSALFAKYMDDMAGDVCAKAIERDRTAAAGSERLVMVEEDIDANLRFLRLKLHGIWVPEGSTEGLGDLRELYDDIFGETGEASTAWYGVCVAMLSAPELLAY